MGHRPPAGRFLLLAALAASMWPSAGAGAPPRVTGSVASRERIALPPGYLLRVELRDVSRQDVAAETIAAKEMQPRRPLPARFALAYDPRRIDPSHIYAVSARILIGGRLAFISTHMYPVITRGALATANIVVQSVGRRTH